MTIHARRIGWLSVTTDRFAEMRAFYERHFGLRPVFEEAGFALYHLVDGTGIELFSSEYEGREAFRAGPVAGFEVADVAAARAELEAAGIEFITPLRTAADGGQWCHFRGPDGNIYEITRPGH